MLWLNEGFMKGFEGICVEDPYPECNRRMNKQYRIGGPQAQYKTHQESATNCTYYTKKKENSRDSWNSWQEENYE